MTRLPLLAALILPLAACSGGDDEGKAVTRFDLAQADHASGAPAPKVDTMPGRIDPPGAQWLPSASGAVYGEIGKPPLLELACQDGMVSATRNIGSAKGAKALLAFVGYRGVLRLKVENDGTAWRGALRSDDPHWKAVSGGPFYATVAGGGTVMSDASSVAAQVITGCRPEPDAVIKGAPGEGDEVEPVPVAPVPAAAAPAA